PLCDVRHSFARVAEGEGAGDGRCRRLRSIRERVVRHPVERRKMSLSIRSVQPRLLVLCGLAALCCFLAFAAGSARAADPAIFKVGAAKVDVTPTTPQYMGGYGDP